MAITNAVEYAKVAKLAYDTVQEVMRQGEADGKSGWEEQHIMYTHLDHARDHIDDFIFGSEVTHSEEGHLRHALTRCAMAYYLWVREQADEREENTA